MHTLGRDGEDGPTYQCEECSCVFKKLGSLNAHISRAHQDCGVRIAALCNFIFVLSTCLIMNEIFVKTVKRDTDNFFYSFHFIIENKKRTFYSCMISYKVVF